MPVNSSSRPSMDPPSGPPATAGHARWWRLRPLGPWWLQSQGYVALLGGCVAVTAIALVNAARLGVPTRGRVLIGCAGAAGLLLTALIWNIGADRVPYSLLAHAPAVAAHLVQIGPQRPYDPGTTLLSRDEAHAPMWIPGAIAVLAGNLLEGALLLLLGG
ncbi:hypothetical protein [Streptosporangium sandarakinum]|uniref:hypothetical protein n=1 Tax=Streptosporangium sandarakinum TaxID=1260955 RepID=UPI003798CF17